MLYSKESMIPLFPLDIVLLPTEEVQLHIFENRYKHMIKDCIENSEKFGVVLKDKKKIANVGCTASIKEVLKDYVTGEYDVLIKGDKKFNVTNMLKDKNLWVGEIEYFKESNHKINHQLLTDTHDKYLNILLNHKITKDIDREVKKSKSFEFVKKILLPNNLKQMFLELNSEKERLLLLNDLFDKVIKAKTNQNIDDLN